MWRAYRQFIISCLFIYYYLLFSEISYNSISNSAQSTGDTNIRGQSNIHEQWNTKTIPDKGMQLAASLLYASTEDERLLYWSDCFGLPSNCSFCYHHSYSAEFRIGEEHWVCSCLPSNALAVLLYFFKSQSWKCSTSLSFYAVSSFQDK